MRWTSIHRMVPGVARAPSSRKALTPSTWVSPQRHTTRSSFGNPARFPHAGGGARLLAQRPPWNLRSGTALANTAHPAPRSGRALGLEIRPGRHSENTAGPRPSTSGGPLAPCRGAALPNVKVVDAQPGQAKLATQDPGTLVVEDTEDRLRDWFLCNRGRIAVIRPDRYLAALTEENEIRPAIRQLRQLLETKGGGWQ